MTSTPNIDLCGVIPILTPASFYALGNWPGPFATMSDVGLTWSILRENQIMSYVTHQMAQKWEESGMTWHRVALDNLARMTADDPATHRYNNASGETFAAVFMHADGCGPSRLLLHDQISRSFATPYEIAVPEMSVGVALSSSATDAERAKIVGLVEQCFSEGTRPLSTRFYRHDEFRELIRSAA